MFRTIVRTSLLEEKLRRRVQRALLLCVVIGAAWLLSGPLYAKPVTTEENALAGRYLSSEFENDRSVTRSFHKFKHEIERIDTTKDPKGHFNFVKAELGKRAEVYTQQLHSVGMAQKHNVYAYFRSKDGYGQECNFLAAPLEYKASIVYLMTFLETLSLRQPAWQSRDILVLFYPESDYSLSVKEFVDAYYATDTDDRI